MFNRLQHNRLASTLGLAIQLDLVSSWAKVSQCNIASDLVILVPNRHGWYVLMPSQVSGRCRPSQLTRSCHRERVLVSLISSRHPEHPSIWVLSRHGSFRAHAMSFTDTVLDSGCIMQPPTLRLRHNIGTPVLLGTVHEQLISKEVAPDTCLDMLALTVTPTYAIW